MGQHLFSFPRRGAAVRAPSTPHTRCWAGINRAVTGLPRTGPNTRSTRAATGPQPDENPMARRRPNPEQRGLGHAHKQQVKHLKTRHVDGTPCWWCGKPMYLDRTRNPDYNPTSPDPASGSLAGDHTLARTHGGTLADRLLHGRCNKQRGDGRHDHTRPALTGQHQPTPTTHLAINCWP
ncbi:HNH endonuclease [Gordonia phage KappaFarmDelta]|nr:HNH endonuclease [Gordonia phage KappaFarmDelta]